MAQKFTSLEEAANLLGVSKDRLNQLREAGAVRAYRDGASWKFRAEDIEKLSSEGLPHLDSAESDIGLDLDAGDEVAINDDVVAGDAAAATSDVDLAAGDDELMASPPSDLNLEEIDEPTVAADVGDDEPADVLSLDEDSIDLSDSILLSEAEIGAASNRPPSTIIGKAELDLGSDLDLSGAEDDAESDLTLAPGSDILSAAPGDDLALEMEPPSPSGSFEGLQELEVDLEAESSRILAPEDVAKVKGAAAAAAAAATSDLELAPSDSDPGRGVSDINIGGESAAGTGLTGLSALELDDDGDDDVLGEGSDVTLSSESSGINIISPSDSGLALDEVPLDLSGSTPMGSSLDLGEVGEAEEAELEPLAIGGGAASQIGGEDFQLTPVGDDADEEDKDSSQVIALDEVAEEESAAAPLGAIGDSQILSEDFGAVGLGPGAVTISDPMAETPFSTANVVMLACCMVLLAACGMLSYDLLRNMWSWDEVTTFNSSLLEVLNPFL
jgi:excisionase family DNA binding protein